jgi:hypothetical protein
MPLLCSCCAVPTVQVGPELGRSSAHVTVATKPACDLLSCSCSVPNSLAITLHAVWAWAGSLCWTSPPHCCCVMAVRVHNLGLLGGARSRPRPTQPVGQQQQHDTHPLLQGEQRLRSVWCQGWQGLCGRPEPAEGAASWPSWSGSLQRAPGHPAVHQGRAIACTAAPYTRCDACVGLPSCHALLLWSQHCNNSLPPQSYV